MPTKFKGGPCTMKQGGIGPDDYLFRLLPRGLWHRVIIRHKPEDGGRAAYESDLVALSTILKNCERVHMGELARIAQEKESKGRPVRVLSATHFLKVYGGQAS